MIDDVLSFLSQLVGDGNYVASSGSLSVPASGTGLVTLGTAQTIAGAKIFSSGTIISSSSTIVTALTLENGTSGGNPALDIQHSTDAGPRLQIQADGGHYWGSGDGTFGIQFSASPTLHTWAKGAAGGTIDFSQLTDVKVPTAASPTDSDNSAASTSWVQALFGNPTTSRPVGRIQQTVAQSIPNSAWTAMTFNATALTDTDGMTVTASQLTCVTGGEYQINANAAFAVNGTGERGIRICHHNSAGTVIQYYGSQVLAAHAIGPNEYATSASVVMAAGDYIQAELYQSSGGALLTGVSVGVSTSSVPLLSAAWVGNTSGAWGNAGVQAYHNATQNTSGSIDTWASLSLNSEVFDIDGEHDLVTNNTRATCVTPGTYIFVGNAAIDYPTTEDFRGLRILKNGTDIPGSTYIHKATSSQGNTTNIQCVAITQMKVGDYVELQAVSHIASQAVHAGNTGNGIYACSLSGVRVGYQSNPSDFTPGSVSNYTLAEGTCFMGASQAVGTFYLNTTGGLVSTGNLFGNGVPIITLDPTRYPAPTGRTAKLRLVVTTLTNSTAQTGVTHTIGLAAVTSPTGAANTITQTVAAQQAGSTCAFAAQAANTQATVVSAGLSMPGSGIYTITDVQTGATTPASSGIYFSWQLQMYWA